MEVLSGSGGSEEGKASWLLTLPPDALLEILFLVPLDTRLRCAELSRGFRDFLKSPEAACLWARIDLSASSGVKQLSPALLNAAFLRAAGQPVTLDLSGHSDSSLTVATLLPILLDRGETVTSFNSLQWDGRSRSPAYFPSDEPAAQRIFQDALSAEDTSALLVCMPHLTTFKACVVQTTPEVALQMLRREHPFASLELQLIAIRGYVRDSTPELYLPLDASMLAAAVTAAPSLKELRLESFDTLNLTVIADGVVASRLTSFKLDHLNSLSRADLPMLTRMLEHGCLETLEVIGERDYGEQYAIFRGSHVDDFCRALAASRTLSRLKLSGMQLSADSYGRAAVVRACVKCESLTHLRFGKDDVFGSRDVLFLLTMPSFLGRIQSLKLTGCGMRLSDIRSLFDAIAAHSTRLRMLAVSCYEAGSHADYSWLLPALAKMTSVEKLDLRLFQANYGRTSTVYKWQLNDLTQQPAAIEAMDFVAQRSGRTVQRGAAQAAAAAAESE